MEIRALERHHRADAAALVADRVRRARQEAPALPARWETPGPYEAEMERLEHHGSGVAMTHRGRLLGFLAAVETDWGYGPVAWTPEWAWAAIAPPGSDRRSMIEDLYAAASERWFASGARVHWLSVISGDHQGLEAFAWLGFGHHLLNGIRNLGPVEPSAKVLVRHARGADASVLAELEEGLRTHLAGSPVFLGLPPPRPLDEQLRRIGDDTRAVLLAEVEGEVVGHLLIGPVADDVATIVQDPGTASITGAFVRPEHRRGGVAQTLLAVGIEWAARRGYERVGVDFETANLHATRFWLRHFQPATHGLVRRL